MIHAYDAISNNLFFRLIQFDLYISRRASIPDCTPYWNVVHSLSFVCVVIVENYCASIWPLPKINVTSDGGVAKKRKANIMEMKLDIFKRLEMREIATDIEQLHGLSHSIVV